MRRASRGDEEALVQLSGHLERGVTPEVAGRDCYDADAAIAAGILDKGFVHLSSGLYTVKVNTDKVKEEEIARLEEMVEAINKKMGRKMIRVERTKDINTTHQFECKRRGKVTVSKVNVTPHKDARDRTLAILNLGLAASTIPDDIKDVTPYKALIAYINEQYKSLNLNGRILIENPEDPEEIIEKLHGSIINVILPPVRRQDFEKFEELDMQMQALDRAA